AGRPYRSIRSPGDRQSFGPALSGFGWGVAFTSGSDNLIADDSETGGLNDVFLWGANPLVLPFMSVRSTNTTNTIEWITPQVNYASMQAFVSPSCPTQFSDPTLVALATGSPPANTSARFTDPTVYPPGQDRCYSIFRAGDSAGIGPTTAPIKTITAHTIDDTTGPVKWTNNVSGIAALA